MELNVTKNPLKIRKDDGQENVGDKMVSSLLFLSAKSDHVLQYFVSLNRSVDVFLRLMGITWILSDSSVGINIIQAIWGIIIRCSLVLVMIYGILYAIINTLVDPNEASLAILMGITLLLQGVSLLFALHDMSVRLKSHVPVIAIEQLSNGLKAAYIVLAISILLGVLPFTAAVQAPSVMACYLIGECALSCVLTATMFFISLDCSIAMSLLKLLFDLLDKELLTFEQYSIVRSEIRVRQSGSSWINNTIVIVALLDIACVLLFVFFNLLSASVSSFVVVGGLFLKEIPFLFVVYWQVAQVNEKSYKLLKQLGSQRWNAEGNADHERVAIYVNAQSNPICMSLAGMKLKRRDLAWQFALWCFAFVVSILKAAFNSHVHYD